jgi:hypothetical protein
MSELEANGQKTAADHVAEENQEQVEIKDAKAVLKKNAELLSKLKTEKTIREELEKKINEAEQEKLASSGKKDELIENLKKQLASKDTELKQTTQNFAWKSVKQQVIETARAMGAENPEAVMRLADLKSVAVNDDYSADADALKSVLEQVKAEVPMLFKKQVAAPKDGTPNYKPEGQKTLGNMTIAELKDLYTKKALGQ